jgi:diguanylate cyclase (GGDEF)-like protein/PAS domain S-box-containing protein
VTRNHGFVVDLADRLVMLGSVLAANATCSVGVVDAARNVIDAGPALAEVGIDVQGHRSLAAGALVEFVAVSDVALLSETARRARVDGTATGRLRLRNGQVADLYLVALSDTELTVAVVIVPAAGDTIVGPAPSAIAANSRVGEIVCNAFGVMSSVSPSTLVLLGDANAAMVGSPVVNVIHPDDREMAIVNWLAAKDQRGEALRWRCRLVRADGSALWSEVTITNDIDINGDGGVQLELYDVSLEVAATEALVAERELLGLLTETLPVGVAKFDASGRVEHANVRLSELLAPADPHELLGQAANGELEDLDLAVVFNALFQAGVSSHVVVDHRGSDGAIRHLEWTIRAAVGHAGEVTGGVVCIADVTEAAQLRDALEIRATTDMLTGCLNRAGTIAAVERALANVGRSDGVGLLFIDLDGFKGINDTRGHAVGDAVLEVVATRLRGGSRPRDLIGRLGGDEFVIIAPGLHSANATLVFAERISRGLHGSATVAGGSVPIAASIGVAWTSTGTARELINAADGAMYTAKQNQCREPVLAAPLVN